MVTILDFMKNNDDCKIQIFETPTMEDVGICNEKIFEGMLSEVPTEFQNREVVHEGFALVSQCNNLYVMR